MSEEGDRRIAEMFGITYEEYQEIASAVVKMLGGTRIADVPTTLRRWIDSHYYSDNMLVALSFEAGVVVGMSVMKKEMDEHGR